jgi:dipeptidyl aminopeptidase/acylaminoacyl peptidase
MEDLRTPVEGAHQLFVALKDLHPELPVKLVLYPHVGHNQPSDSRQLLHYYHEMLAWFDQYL